MILTPENTAILRVNSLELVRLTGTRLYNSALSVVNSNKPSLSSKGFDEPILVNKHNIREDGSLFFQYEGVGDIMYFIVDHEYMRTSIAKVRNVYEFDNYTIYDCNGFVGMREFRTVVVLYEGEVAEINSVYDGNFMDITHGNIMMLTDHYASIVRKEGDERGSTKTVKPSHTYEDE